MNGEHASSATQPKHLAMGTAVFIFFSTVGFLGIGGEVVGLIVNMLITILWVGVAIGILAVLLAYL